MKKDIDILIITGGGSRDKTVAENIDKLLKILLNITDNIHLVTFCSNKFISGLNNKNIHSLKLYKNRFKQFLYAQILMSKVLFSISRTNDIKIVLFAFGQDLQLVPMILAKIVAKKTIIRSDGRPTVVLKKYVKDHSRIKRYFFKLIEEINYRLADVVFTECKYMILENNFQKYNSRVGNLFVDVERFVNKNPIDLRKYDIGFVGQLTKRKGILNFLESLEILDEGYNVVIKGDGEEKNNVLSRIQVLKSKFKIDYIDWVKREKLPDYFNEIKMLVLPTYIEGLPNIVLEAMACGTIVLATPVGGIPGVVKDEKTGFIMESNSPECIAENIIRAIEHHNLNKIVKNARKLIEEEYAYKVTIERYSEIFENI